MAIPALFTRFLRRQRANTPIVKRLRQHFRVEPRTLPIVAQEFESAEHPNVQVAVDAYLATEGRSADLLGIVSGRMFGDAGLSDLVAPVRPVLRGEFVPVEGPVQYANVELDGDRFMPCVQYGLYLIREGRERLALLVRGPSEHRPMRKSVIVEVMARARDRADQFLAAVRSATRKRSVYRGQAISLKMGAWPGEVEVRFHKLPRIERDQIILPEDLLRRIERQTVGFFSHSERLLAAGRHLKRGILLYGPPGTGKTLTAMYLVRQMRDHTILILTGRGMGLIERSCAMARLLQPSVVILEDVDLVAEERTQPARPACTTPLLFELLNEMDGLADDCNVLFLLTTNRPDILEPALAARPGRVDQAFELPLPDPVCRQRLFELYARGLTLRAARLNDFVKRTEGVSAAFIRELMRKAALFAAEEGAEIAVGDTHLESALHELMTEGGPFTKSFLGFRPP
jgi:hypothetical protein